MPNWCENRLWVFGFDEEAVKQATEFLEKTKEESSDLVFYKLVPLDPENEKAWDYEKAVDMWGTKWEPCDVQLVLEDLAVDYVQLEYSFNTAWSPPFVWLRTVSRKFPHLLFLLSYFEPGVGFMGVAKFKNGEEDVRELEWE